MSELIKYPAGFEFGTKNYLKFMFIVKSDLQINPIDIDGTHSFLFFYVSNIEIPQKGTLDNPAGTTSRVV